MSVLPDDRVALKRGYTAGYSTVYAQDPRVRTMELFDRELDKIFDELFVETGQFMDVPTSRFQEAAERFGIPWEIASQGVEFRMRNFGH